MSAAPPQSPFSAAGGPAQRPPEHDSHDPAQRSEVRLPGLSTPTARRSAFIGAEVLAVVAMVALAVVGFNRVLDSHEGKLDSSSLGPNEPNFEANVTSTPTALLLGLDAAGDLSSAVVLSITSTTLGSVLFVPPTTIVNDQWGDPNSTTTTAPGTVRPTTLADILEEHSQVEAGQALAEVLGTSFTEVVVEPHDQLVQLLEPVAPLAFDNPDAVTPKAGKSFRKGALSLSAADAVSYLETHDSGESDNARMVRQQALWEAWFGAVASSKDPNVVPGETTSGLGRYVRAIAPLQHRISTLPTTIGQQGSQEVFNAKAPAVASEMAVMVPYPTSAHPGARVRVRVLDGAVPPGQAAELEAKVAALLVPAGAEIIVLGNADSFTKANTEVIAHEPELHDKAVAMQAALRVGTVVDAEVPTDAQDVTVIIGQDLADSLK